MASDATNLGVVYLHSGFQSNLVALNIEEATSISGDHVFHVAVMLTLHSAQTHG